MEYLRLGGFFIWPILVESVLALWVIIERYIAISTLYTARKQAMKDLTATFESGERIFPETPGSISSVMTKAWKDKRLEKPALLGQADSLIKEFEKNLLLLYIVAQTAPMLGLLGTVAGIIKAFVAIQSQIASGNQINPLTLTEGIWEALIATSAGLIVGIIALIAYTGFTRVVDRFEAETEVAVSQVINEASRAGLEVI
jgi:biopolymer transport protein ExbB